MTNKNGTNRHNQQPTGMRVLIPSVSRVTQQKGAPPALDTLEMFTGCVSEIILDLRGLVPELA